MQETNLNIKLINYTPNPERTVAAAARLCYSPVGANKLVEEMTDKEIEDLLAIILGNRHYSTLEHVSFTFAIEGISRVTSHQLVRHRLASYSQQSQRYVREKEQFDYIIPDKIKGDKELVEIFEENMWQQQQKYDELTKKLMENGYQEKEAIEAARYLLPNATETKIVVSMNARSLLHFFEVRCCERAQKEIRKMAREMLRQVKDIAPIIFNSAGPLCETERRCKEGKMSCGRLNKITSKGVDNTNE
ncbi:MULTISPECIES: FAD-dependent thymidylate synthase [unclassified Candidatus Frackibacter]|uniref:FAD-dependent thymidylate synthase n=1 Tax=unclassified Candidatus Frackibacter TaxID=2648818 RepID=UPI00088E1435|nr:MULTISPECIES: FAD-dependent thymidylate synthase [unclassified Candidatus Frackibacter]SDC21488.1 thymidylate synthase (FAD) [Candidatus Frackibacter sp. WG11]SEM50342.1 thymidylate synthase (FAD) [Candidatus Frackibacter sp. WG12]SFL51762.1 thymidylate synthase (FAD) [Candidatus Frackibacter sp. WG13]